MAETTSAGKDAGQRAMIDRPLFWLVLASLVIASMPAAARETNPPSPDRNPARVSPAKNRTTEAALPALPDRNPATKTATMPVVPSPDRRPGSRETPESAPPPERNPATAETAEREWRFPWERDPASPAKPESIPPPERPPASADRPDGAPAPERNPHSAKMPKSEMTRSAPPEGETVVTTPDDVPLPDRKPLPGDRPTLTWKNPKVEAARARCAKLLEGRPIDYERLQPIRRGACGAPAPILVKSIGKDPAVVIAPPATISCDLAAALHIWLRDKVQPAAATLGSPVTKIRNASSYKCRNRYGGANTRISEHALANALDILEFVLASGERVTVLDNWQRPPPSPAPPPLPDAKPTKNAEAADALPITKAKAVAAARPSPPPVAKPPAPSLAERKSIFLRTIHADGCKTFETMLGPDTNAAHKDHFHLDMKKRHYVKICE